jgi:hypothetical protein
VKAFGDMRKTLLPLVVAAMLVTIVIPAAVMSACSGMSLFGHSIPGMESNAVFESVCGMIGDPSAPDGIVVTSLLTFLVGLLAVFAGRLLFAPEPSLVRVVRPMAASPPRAPDDLETERLRL